MRIIAGRYRRRNLLANPGLTTRPITDRVKESLFEHLNPWLQGAKVADIFAGTGTMGLEALSRGASTCVFVEKDKTAFELLRKNIQTLDVKNETFAWLNDVLLTSYRPKDCEEFLPYDVVFFDPPYGMVDQLQVGMMLFKSLDRLAKPTLTADDCRVLLRTPDIAKFVLPRSWTVDRVLEYPSMTIHWLKKAVVAHPDGDASNSEVASATSGDAAEPVAPDAAIEAVSDDSSAESPTTLTERNDT